MWDRVTGVRYLKFVPLTATAQTLSNSQAYGLNELKVFAGTPVSGAIPEPASWAMMLLGFGTIGVAMRRGKVVAA